MWILKVEELHQRETDAAFLQACERPWVGGLKDETSAL